MTCDGILLKSIHFLHDMILTNWQK